MLKTIGLLLGGVGVVVGATFVGKKVADKVSEVTTEKLVEAGCDEEVATETASKLGANVGRGIVLGATAVVAYVGMVVLCKAGLAVCEELSIREIELNNLNRSVALRNTLIDDAVDFLSQTHDKCIEVEATDVLDFMNNRIESHEVSSAWLSETGGE